MAAKYILAALAVLFLVMGITAAARSRPQMRTWLLIGGIFTLVSAWLFYRP